MEAAMMAIAQQPSLVWPRVHPRQEFILAYLWLFWMKIMATGVILDDVPKWMAVICKFAHKNSVLESVWRSFVPMAEQALKLHLKWTGVSTQRSPADMELELMAMLGDAWPKHVFELVYGPARDALSAHERHELRLPEDHRAIFLDAHQIFLSNEALDIISRKNWRQEHIGLLSQPPRSCTLTEPQGGLCLPGGSPDPEPDSPVVSGVISAFSEDPWKAFLDQWATCILSAFEKYFCGSGRRCCKSCEARSARETKINETICQPPSLSPTMNGSASSKSNT